MDKGQMEKNPSGSKAFDEFLEGAAARFLDTFRNPNMSMTDRLKCTFDIKAMSLDIMAGSIGGSDSQGIRADFGGKCGKYSVGDAAFMDSNDAFLRNISNRVDIDANGYFDVIAHGTPNGIQITHNGQKMIVDSRIAARLIQNTDGYNGQAIRL